MLQVTRYKRKIRYRQSEKQEETVKKRKKMISREN